MCKWMDAISSTAIQRIKQIKHYQRSQRVQTRRQLSFIITECTTLIVLVVSFHTIRLALYFDIFDDLFSHMYILKY